MIVIYIFGIRMQQMKPLVKLSLINLQLFCISILCLFFLGLTKIGHSQGAEDILKFFLGFVLLHFIINGILLYRFKAKYFNVIVVYFEAIVLYGLIAWWFSS
jgi:hypothetical protein